MTTEGDYKAAIAAIDEAAKEFICPITMELPIDPVMAEDGKIYDRAAVQKHISMNSERTRATAPAVSFGGTTTPSPSGQPNFFGAAREQDEDRIELRSPATNEKMGKKLTPAVQVRNAIRALIKSGAVEGELAERWRKVDDTRSKAESGDADAMYLLGSWYFSGDKGFLEDGVLAYSWFKKAADQNSVEGMAMQGFCLSCGAGVTKNEAEGAFLLGRAQALGSNFATLEIGMAYFKGFSGFPIDWVKAKHYLSKAVNQGELKEYCFKAAKMALQEIQDNLL